MIGIVVGVAVTNEKHSLLPIQLLSMLQCKRYIAYDFSLEF